MQTRPPEERFATAAQFFAHLRGASPLVGALAEELDDALVKTLSLDGDLAAIAMVITDGTTHALLAKERTARIVDHRLNLGEEVAGAPTLWIQSYRRLPLVGILTRHVNLSRARLLQRWQRQNPPVVALYDGQCSYHLFPHAERRLAVERMALQRSIRPRSRPTLAKLATQPSVKRWLDRIDRFELESTGSVRRRTKRDTALGLLVGHDPYHQMRRSLLHAVADGVPLPMALERLHEQFQELENLGEQCLDALRAAGVTIDTSGSGANDIARVLPLPATRAVPPDQS